MTIIRRPVTTAAQIDGLTEAHHCYEATVPADQVDRYLAALEKGVNWFDCIAYTLVTPNGVIIKIPHTFKGETK